MVLFDYVLLEDLIWIYIIARHTSKEDLLSPPMLLREYCNSQMPSDRDPDLRALNLLFPI